MTAGKRRAIAAGCALLAFATLFAAGLQQHRWAETSNAITLHVDGWHSIGDGLGSLIIVVIQVVALVRIRRSKPDLERDDVWAQRLIVVLMMLTAGAILLSAQTLDVAPDDHFDTLIGTGGAVGFLANGIAFYALWSAYRATNLRCLATDAWHAVIDMLGSVIVLVSPVLPHDLAWIAVAAIAALILWIIGHEAVDAFPWRRWWQRLTQRRSAT